MNFKTLFTAVAMAILIACGGGGSSTSTTTSGGTSTSTTTFPGKFRANATVSTVAAPTIEASVVGSNSTTYMHEFRIHDADVFLPDGKILFIGGQTVNTTGPQTMEYFNPVDEKFYSLSTPLTYGRMGSQALLMGDGKVYIFGGIYSTDPAVTLTSSQKRLVEIMDPSTGVITRKTCQFSFQSHFTRAFRISSNEILFFGGVDVDNGGNYIDPTIVNINDMSVTKLSTDSRFHLTTFAYAQAFDGSIYFFGGLNLGSNITSNIVKFDSNNRTVSVVGQMPQLVHDATAVPLKDGTILVAGGMGGTDHTTFLTDLDIFNPTDNSIHKVADMPQGRMQQLGAQLPNGRILLAGGNNNGMAVADQLIYDPLTHTCGYTGKMITTRVEHRLDVLPTGRILISGGLGNATGTVNSPLNSAEIFEPEANVYITFDTLMIPGGASYQFQVQYTGSVVWTCDQGNIDSSTGLWTAPWTFTKNIATITATSTTDATKFAYCFMTISDPKDVIKIQDPGVVALNATTQLTYTVFYIKPTTVVWTVTKADGSATTDATVSVDGVFTATKIGTYKVTATSTVDARYNNTIQIVVQ